MAIMLENKQLTYKQIKLEKQRKCTSNCLQTWVAIGKVKWMSSIKLEKDSEIRAMQFLKRQK